MSALEICRIAQFILVIVALITIVVVALITVFECIFGKYDVDLSEDELEDDYLRKDDEK